MGDVTATLTQRRQGDREDGEAIEEVFSKRPGRDGFVEVAIGGGDHAEALYVLAFTLAPTDNRPSWDEIAFRTLKPNCERFMAVITISDELLERVEQSRPNLSTAEFVADAVREKLAWQERRSEFFRLSDETRRQLDKQGIGEAEILSDFDTFRESLTRG